MQEVTFNLTATVAEAETPFNLAGTSTQEESLRRRIIAVSEGIHNVINFSGEKICRIVDAAIKLKEEEGRENFATTLVLDRFGEFLDIRLDQNTICFTMNK